MIATSGFLTALKCTKFDFSRGSAGGAYSALTDSLAGLRGPTSKGRGGKGMGKKGREGQGTGEWEEVAMPGKGEGKGGRTGGEGRKVRTPLRQFLARLPRLSWKRGR